MENKQNQRILFDTECKNCNKKQMCKWTDTEYCCRSITDKLRVELRNNKKQRKIIAKITVNTEYNYNNHTINKTVSKEGTFVLQEPYIFGKPFMRAEISGKNNEGTFSTKYYGWCK